MINENKSYLDITDIKYQVLVLARFIKSTLILICAFVILLTISYFGGHNQSAASRAVLGIGALLYLVVVAMLFRRRLYDSAAHLLVIFYLSLSCLALWQWGVNLAFPILMFAITITLSGILLGPNYALYTGAFSCFNIIVLQVLTTASIYNSDFSWQSGQPSRFGEAVGYCLMVVVLTLISWASGRHSRRALVKEKYALAEVMKQKRLLATRLKERTETLKALQLKEMQQLYKFAELGQLSTALFHDLANRLAVLALDLEALQNPQTQHMLDRANSSITYIGGLVDEMRRQLSNEENHVTFNLEAKLRGIIHKHERSSKGLVATVALDTGKIKNDPSVRGDPARLAQIINIVLHNALDATKDSSNRPSRVEVSIEDRNNEFQIRISDYGEGISANAKAKIFKPFFGTKKGGMGIGLFIARQIARTHFQGDLVLEHLKLPTTFKLTIPKAIEKLAKS